MPWSVSEIFRPRWNSGTPSRSSSARIRIETVACVTLSLRGGLGEAQVLRDPVERPDLVEVHGSARLMGWRGLGTETGVPLDMLMGGVGGNGDADVVEWHRGQWPPPPLIPPQRGRETTEAPWCSLARRLLPPRQLCRLVPRRGCRGVVAQMRLTPSRGPVPSAARVPGACRDGFGAGGAERSRWLRAAALGCGRRGRAGPRPSRGRGVTETRSSKTKHSPLKRLSVSGTASRYFRMPPLRWNTSSKPCDSM